jgi:hypothetical protein
MSGKLFFTRARAIAQMNLSIGPKAVLNALNVRSNAAGECWPSHETIARDIGSSGRSVRTYLGELMDKQFVEMVRGGGRGVSNRYRLKLPAENAETVAGFPDPEGEGNPEESAGFPGGGSVVNAENPALNAENPALNAENPALNAETVSAYPPRSPQKPSKGARNKFQKPTVEQVRQFAETANLPVVEAEAFCDYFDSNGWRVGGRSPMKDWQAAFRNWVRRSLEFKRGASAGNGPAGSPEAEQAWGAVVQAIRQHSGYEQGRIQKEVGERAFAAARKAGGVSKIENANNKPTELAKLKAAFIGAFEGASS